MNELLQGSKEIMEVAIATYKPKAIVMMLSGGDDSITAYSVAKELGYKFDYVIHGKTGTGLKETTDFAIDFTNKQNDKLIIADAKDAYEKYVLRKGFFGLGLDAHTMAYHILKIEHFRKAVSHNLRKRQRNFPILFVNGARRLESENRKKTMVSPYKLDPSQKNNIWVNIINEWTKENCIDYLEGNSVKRNPVSIALCRSGECMCGTMQNLEDYAAAKEFSPKWGKQMDDLRKEVMKKFPWDWGQNINKQHLMEMKGQIRMDFQPMCTGCKVKYKSTA
ncbi:phosphoadenosine phosphosulfate reductase family protein [Flavobacteriaceae bacterium TK19130]|nr:phosphoadenosine phosphosulfate reductase family protein [Thermobacterium salinum]